VKGSGRTFAVEREEKMSSPGNANERRKEGRKELRKEGRKKERKKASERGHTMADRIIPQLCQYFHDSGCGIG